MLATLFLAAAKVEDVKAKNPILPEGKEILWASIAFVIVLSLLAWKAWPAVEGRAQGAPGPHRERPRARPRRHAWKPRARSRTTAVSSPRRATRRPGSSRRPVRTPSACAGSASPRSTTSSQSMRARAAEDIRLATERAMSDLSTRGRRAVDRAGREGRRAQPRPRHADRADRELHQPGREQLAVPESSRIEAYANALLEVARAEGHLAEVEDELFRFARTFEGNDELRMALSDPRAARRPPGRGGRGAARRQGAADERGAGARSWSRPDAPASSRRSSTGSWSSPPRSGSKAVAEVRSAMPLDQRADRAPAGRR